MWYICKFWSSSVLSYTLNLVQVKLVMEKVKCPNFKEFTKTLNIRILQDIPLFFKFIKHIVFSLLSKD
jgi:hypothetical protein